MNVKGIDSYSKTILMQKITITMHMHAYKAFYILYQGYIVWYGSVNSLSNCP